MGLKMKNFNILGVWRFKGEVGGGGEGAWQERGGEVFEEGLVLQCTLWPRRNKFFVVQDTIGPILGDLGAITLVSNITLSWNFDHR